MKLPELTTDLDTSSTEALKKQDVITKLNHECALMPWAEVQRFFAAGMMIYVQRPLDLLEASAEISLDNSALLNQWMSAGLVGRVSDEQATQWQATDMNLWSVVVAPWIFVQPAIPE